ncbi:MAG TPA: hypothetical protein VE967_12495 [Gemmatimonadaceae bacterium]|nr:hypothetical protein [Gemmatimonadaceae bacterium]
MTVSRDRLVALYRGIAYGTLNTVVLLIALNVALGTIFYVRDRRDTAARKADPRLISYRDKYADLDAYTKMSREQATAMLDEQDAKGSIGLQYEPWTQFREPTFAGRFLNTDSNGFRRSRAPQARSGAPVRVFVFGGSTTFGYGVSDEHTIPSYLQAALEEKHPNTPFAVRNLGQGYYFSSQEATLFNELVRRGDIPHVAVFIDGGNDAANLGLMKDEPHFSDDAHAMWDQRTHPAPAPPAPSWIPMVRLAHALRNRGGGPNGSTALPSAAFVRPDDSTSEGARRRADYVISHYLHNTRMIDAACAEYRIVCRFVWQPHVAYKYDRSLHKTFPFPGEIPKYYAELWGTMEQRKDPHFLYLGDMFATTKKKVYVDDVHYNETTNEQIARRIADVLPPEIQNARRP